MSVSSREEDEDEERIPVKGVTKQWCVKFHGNDVLNLETATKITELERWIAEHNSITTNCLEQMKRIENEFAGLQGDVERCAALIKSLELKWNDVGVQVLNILSNKMKLTTNPQCKAWKSCATIRCPTPHGCRKI